MATLQLDGVFKFMPSEIKLTKAVTKMFSHIQRSNDQREAIFSKGSWKAAVFLVALTYSKVWVSRVSGGMDVSFRREFDYIRMFLYNCLWYNNCGEFK